MAHLRHASRPGDYPLFGQDRKSLTQRQTDANDPKRISEAQPLDSAHDPADLNEREAGDPWGNGRPNAFDQQRPSPPRASRDRSSPDKLIGANAMRSFLALSLLMILCASASAATVHHTIPRHHVIIARHHVIVRPGRGFPGYAVPGWAYAAPRPAVHYDDTPSYNDPSKFGGSTALPIEK